MTAKESESLTRVEWEGNRERLRKVKIPIAGITKNGKVYGTIPKHIRDQIDFDNLVEEADEGQVVAEISFNKLHDDE